MIRAFLPSCKERVGGQEVGSGQTPPRGSDWRVDAVELHALRGVMVNLLLNAEGAKQRGSLRPAATLEGLGASTWTQVVKPHSPLIFMVDVQNASPSASLRNGSLCDPALTAYRVMTDGRLNASDNFYKSPSNCSAVGGGALQLPTFTTAAKVRVIITCILCGISAFCNLAVLWAAHGEGRRKSHVRVLIINLTAADLLVTFIVMPVDAVWNVTVQWLAGDFACRLLMFLKLQAMYSCAFVTVVISLDRQSAILNPLAINKARQRNRVMLTAAWGMSVLLSVPQIFLFHNVTIIHPKDFTQCTTRGSFVAHWHETAYNMFTFSCLFLLPLVIMITCYSRIFCEISKRLKKDNLPFSEMHLRRSKNNIPKARLRTLKMSIVIVSSFIVCWTPYYLLGLWYWFFPDHLEGKVSHSLTHILFIFGLVNACLDPVIYGLFTIHFRKGLRRCHCNASRPSDLESNTVLTASFTLPPKREVSPGARERPAPRAAHPDGAERGPCLETDF